MTLLELARKAEVRLRAHTEVRGPDECWPWTGALNTAGYGQIQVWDGGHRRGFNAHRLAFVLAKGDPGPLLVRHRCDWRPCMNPAHLFAGTGADNAADMVERGRSCRGEDHPRAVLDADDVRVMRELASRGRSRSELAEVFGVSSRAVAYVLRGERWGHVPLRPPVTA